ncbi:MAG: HD domain-containing phosphohydrolase [Clostridia bacterium]
MEQSFDIKNSIMDTIMTYVRISESRDSELRKHVLRIQQYSRALALEMQRSLQNSELISAELIENIFLVSPLHDIGKTHIPERILLKNGRLTEEEFECMKTHCTKGEYILTPFKEKYPSSSLIKTAIDIVRHHHERYDGRGYPDALGGEYIPVSARIMAIADVYDALRSAKTYKETFQHEAACHIISEGKGTQFDPLVIDNFMKIHEVFQQIFSETD